MLYSLTQGMRGSMPCDVQHVLEQAFYRCVAENTLCLNQLEHLQPALSRTGTSLLLLKGAALAQTLYGESAQRQFGDIDLAVPVENVPACRKALIELGYVPSLVEQQPGALLAHRNQELFEPPHPYRAMLELHWHILDVPYYLQHVPMDWFWKNTDSLLVAGEPFQVLNPEANLIYLPAHLALHHRFQRLHSLFDLALLIVKHHDQLDWQKVFNAAYSFELISALRATLERLAQCWPELPIDEPRHMLQIMQPSPTDARLFSLLTAESRTNFLDYYTILMTLPDFTARRRYAWVNLFPQPEYMMKRYAIQRRWQLPFWYLFRLTGGLFRFVSKLPLARRIARGSH